ncbi:DNA-protecting protein DprA [Candidatus Peribacteria bacterium]|nr:DNA-protecting protein DprA [Candidatus Peribacteria bacterium]
MQQTSNTAVELLAVHRCLRLSGSRYARMAAACGGEWSRWRTESELWIRQHLSSKEAERLLTNRLQVDLSREQALIDQYQLRLITPEQRLFPEALQHIYQPPGLLFVRGELRSLWFPGVAVVGSRRMTSYAKRCTEHLTAAMAQQGITIISGLAMGVDSLAHQTAVAAGAKTIAVLGSSIDQIHPASSTRWATEQLAAGTLSLVSEYAPGETVSRNNFVVRNRLVSGMSRGVVIIQAGEKSGTMATARIALEQGREIFTVPGDIFALQYEGNNRLLQEGATPVTSGAQIVEALSLSQHALHQEVKQVSPENELESRILALFTAEPQWHMNAIVRALPEDSALILSTLTMMELKGMLRQDSSGHYVRY